MKTFPLFFTAAVACAITLSGCNESPSRNKTAKAIEFRSGIVGVNTRATDTAWETGDQIGVYMLTAGRELNNDNVLAANRRYTTSDGNGVFTSEPDEAIFYPEEEVAVDFVACYPYVASLDGFDYPVNITVQSDPAKIDLLYAKSATGYTSGSPVMTFYHRLTKVVFDVTNLGSESLEGMTVRFSGLNTSGKFNLATTTFTQQESRADIEGVVAVDSNDNTKARVTAILLPVECSYTVSFTLSGGATTSKTIEGNYTQGKKYSYTVRLKMTGEDNEIIVDSSDQPQDWESETTQDLGELTPDGGEPTPEPSPEPSPEPAVAEYFRETFGDVSPGSAIPIATFDGWTGRNDGIAYSYQYNLITVNALAAYPNHDSHLWFTYGRGEQEFQISNLPGNCTNITLGYKIAAGNKNQNVNGMKIFADEHDVTPDSYVMTSANVYRDVVVSIPDGTTSIRFYCNDDTNKQGYRIDNITLCGAPAQ
jgi:predicted cupin superfamily sugar epimerase